MDYNSLLDGESSIIGNNALSWNDFAVRQQRAFCIQGRRIMKKCTKCGRVKRLDDFYRNRHTKDGRASWCQLCVKTSLRAYRQTSAGRESNRKAVLKFQKTSDGRKVWQRANRKYQQTPTGRKTYLESSRKHQRKYPQRNKARHAVGNAIAAKKIPPARNLTCSVCDSQAQSYHHHLGYSKEYRLDVIPLCSKHHIEADKKEKT